MEAKLIELDDADIHVYHKETIWDIENNEKLQLASFIEERILTKVQHLLDEKDKQIKELGQTNDILEDKILDLTLSLENLMYVGVADIKEQLQCINDVVANVADDVAKHTKYLSNSYIDLCPSNLLNYTHNSYASSIFKADVTDLKVGGGLYTIDKVLWNLIENFGKLNKLTIKMGITTFKQTRVSIFTKIKSDTIEELVIMDGSWIDEPAMSKQDFNKFLRGDTSSDTSRCLYLYNYIQDILTNIPNLHILDITCSDREALGWSVWINKFIEKISSCPHKLKQIKLTRGQVIKADLTKLQSYCDATGIALGIIPLS